MALYLSKKRFIQINNSERSSRTRGRNYNNEDEPEVVCSTCCDILIKSKFADPFADQEADSLLLERDLYSKIRGRWNNRLEFLISCVGFVVGIGNVWRFPARVYENGGGTFVIVYTIMCVVFGAPLLVMEFGLGQFSGCGPPKLFKMVPVLSGLGWSMILMSMYIDIYYSSVVAYGYFYLVTSFRRIMPWTVCTHDFNTNRCLGTSEDKANYNITEFVSSTAEYWDYYVTGFIKYPSREPYKMDEYPGSPIWHLTVCLVLSWLATGLIVMRGVRVSGKIVYFTVIYPYFALAAIFFLGCTLPGAIDGIEFYIVPNLKYFSSPSLYRNALEQVFYSIGIAMGGLISFASYNNFRDNFYRDSLLLILIDYMTSIFAGFAIFPILGYMSHRVGVKIDKLLNSGVGLFFITFTEALATVPAAQFWTIMLMLMLISLGLDSQFGVFECIATAIMDINPVLHETKVYKAIIVWIICFLFFVCGLLFVTPGGRYWFEILDKRVTSFGLPILCLMETVLVSFIYGYKQLRYDFKVMTGVLLNWALFITLSYVCPIGIIAIIGASLYKLERITVAGNSIPIWGEMIAVVLLLTLFFPIIGFAILTICKYKKKYKDLYGWSFVKKLFEAPVYWGPYYKKDWIYSKFYRNKLLANKDNKTFLLYVSPYEDMDEIVGRCTLNGNRRI